VPQIADRAEPFRSRIHELVRGRTEELEALAVEMFARGLSVRGIEAAFTDDQGAPVAQQDGGERAQRAVVAGLRGVREPGSVGDALADRRRFRILAIADDFSREYLCLVADTSLSGKRVDASSMLSSPCPACRASLKTAPS
jgi:hypothetical protein